MPPDMVPLGCGAGDRDGFAVKAVHAITSPKLSPGAGLSPITRAHGCDTGCGARHISTIDHPALRGASYSASRRRPAACAGTDGARVARDALKKTTKRQARRTSRPHTPATSMVLAAVQVSWSPVRLKS